MLIVQNNQIIGATGQKVDYPMLAPIYHESGAGWYTCDNADGTYSEANIVNLHKRSLAEVQATPEYQAWIGQHPESLPAIYCDLTFAGGDEKTPILGIKLGHPSKGIMSILGVLQDAGGNALPVTLPDFQWRITVCKIRAESNPIVMDSVPVDGVLISNNTVSMAAFDPETAGLTPGVWAIFEEDFAILSAAQFGLDQDYRVSLTENPVMFKVLK